MGQTPKVSDYLHPRTPSRRCLTGAVCVNNKGAADWQSCILRRIICGSDRHCVTVCLCHALTHCYTPILEMRRTTPACQSADTPDGHLTVTVGHSVSARAARETQHASATLTPARQNANGAARRQRRTASCTSYHTGRTTTHMRAVCAMKSMPMEIQR